MSLLKRPARMCRDHRRKYLLEWVAAFLSGGLDYSTVTGDAAECSDCYRARHGQ